MADSRLITIQSERWQVGLLPDTGASVAFGRIQRGGRWIDFMRPTAEADYDKVSNCASFVLVPYSNRVRERRFTFRGQTYELRATKPDGTVQHGVGRDAPWQVDTAEPTRLIAHFDSADVPDVNFPFHFSARLEYRVEGDEFSISTTIQNEDTRTMPAGFGNHPYFQRAFDGPSDTVSLEIPCSEYFELTDFLPSGGPQPIPPRLDYRTLRPLGDESINDNLTNREDDQPIRFVYTQSGQQVTLLADPIFSSIIFYAPPGKPFFAVEPVSNANDGFNLYAKGIRGSGVFELESGQSQSGIIRFRAEANL